MVSRSLSLYSDDLDTETPSFRNESLESAMLAESSKSVVVAPVMLQRSYIPNTGVKSWKNLVLDDDAPTAVTAQPNAKEDQKAQAAHLKLMRQTASAALAAAAQAVKASKAAYKLQDQTSPESKTPSQQGPTPDQPTKKTKRAKTAPKEMQQSDEHAKHNSQASPISSETIKHTGDEHKRQNPRLTRSSRPSDQQQSSKPSPSVGPAQRSLPRPAKQRPRPKPILRSLHRQVHSPRSQKMLWRFNLTV